MPLATLSKAVKIFFSYAISAPQDKRLLDRLTTHLSILKRQHLIDEWYDSAISAGSTITQFIETYLNTADIIVLLISADFFASERCYEFEMKRALERKAAGEVELIPVILHPTEEWRIPPLDKYTPLPPDGTPVSSNKHNIERTLAEVAKGIRHVVENIASQAKKTLTSTAPPQFPLYHIPYRYNAFFTDRKDILDTLTTSFTSAQTSHTPVLALKGIGGIGKTQIALEYSYRSSNLYQAVLWLNASSRDVLSTEVDTLADRLALPGKDRMDEQELFTAVKRWLQDHPAWLLVLDQIEDMSLVDLIVPLRSNGHVLLTTRMQATGTLASAVPIMEMDMDASISFLLRRARIIPSETTLTQATTIAQELNGFPLALDQAGAYLEETGCGLATYLKLYQDERAALLSQRGQLGQLDNSHPDSVMVTLALAFDKVTRKQATNLDLLHLLAFLHPDTIPDEMIVQGAGELNEPLRSLAARPLLLNQALADLLSFSLVHRCADTTTLRIHRIVQTVLVDTLTIEQRHQWASQVVRMVNRVFPEVSFDTWAACERYLPQAQHCATLIKDYQISLKEATLLLQRLGSYCYRRASYAEAETYLIQALDLHEQQEWDDPLEKARTLNTLALVYYRQADYEQAEELHLQALALREPTLGPDHPQTAESLHNLAMLYGNQGEYQRAEEFYLRVLAIEERTKGTEQPETAKTLNNLGLVYYLQGDYAQAEASYQRALAIYGRTLPANHPDIMYPLSGLGALYEKRSDYPRAEELYQQALAICEQALGDKHPETAHSLNKLADIYESQDKDAEAQELYQRALDIGEQALGPDHPDIALFLNNLAFLANKQEQHEQAEPLYERALAIYEEVLGTEHPVVASVLNNLGRLYRNTHNQERAEECLRRALAIRTESLGPTHPDTAQSLHNLAELLVDQHKYEEAASLFQQALAIRLQVFGPDHPQTIHTREKYAALLKLMGKIE
jgi:tetratricopeptide (TPR) repeat protein